MGEVVGKEACPKCQERGEDTSGDNLVIYDDDSAYCFACEHVVPSKNSNSKPKSNKKIQEIKLSDFITEEEAHIIKKSTVNNLTYRGVRPETAKFFGVRYDLNPDESVKAIYYPCTHLQSDLVGGLSGYKKRIHPKKFVTEAGVTGKECELFGQFRFDVSEYTVLLVAGENDVLSAYQMLRDYQLERGSNFDPIAVVSPTIGEGGCAKQLKNQYKFFSKFKKIVVGFDMDATGQKANEEAIKVLPKGKVYVAKWRYKDPNEYIFDNATGKELSRQDYFIRDFYSAKKHVPAGVMGSNQLMEKLKDHIRIPKVPLPPFMRKLEKEMAGGIPLGYLVNFGSASGGGKTSIVNEMIYYWIFNSPHQIGIVSMELEAGQYAEVMLSRHLSKKIALIEDMDEKIHFVESEENEKKALELFEKENGESRFHLVDDRDGTVEELQHVVEELIISLGCNIIILDPLQDMLDGLNNEEQSMFLKWQKKMIKSHMVTFININHVRKSQSGQQANSAGAFITEEDFAGSSTIFKSAGANVLMTRNKYDEDPIERNTTKVIMSKCRWSGNTGECGEYFYENKTHTLHDKEDWLRENKGKEF